MAKFTAYITRTVERSETVIVSVTKAQVVEELGLEGEDRREWRDHVQDYLENDVERFADAEVVEVTAEDTTDISVDSVEEVD